MDNELKEGLAQLEQMAGYDVGAGCHYCGLLDCAKVLHNHIQNLTRQLSEKVSMDAVYVAESYQADLDVLRKAAQAVVDRWDSPTWKDLPNTGISINDLRKALEVTGE